MINKLQPNPHSTHCKCSSDYQTTKHNLSHYVSTQVWHCTSPFLTFTKLARVVAHSPFIHIMNNYRCFTTNKTTTASTTVFDWWMNWSLAFLSETRKKKLVGSQKPGRDSVACREIPPGFWACREIPPGFWACREIPLESLRKTGTLAKSLRIKWRLLRTPSK